jgi:uncharacterized membrane protein YhaH (DUF805 family)
MITQGKLTKRRFLWMNLLLAALFANGILFAPALKMGEAFTSGLATGIGAGWLVFFIVGGRELRRPGRTFDERAAALAGRAASFAFWVMILALALLTALLRSELLSFEFGTQELAGLVMNLGLVAWGASWAVLSRLR